MKCFLVVNQLNNPVFLDFDEEFTKFVHKKAVEVGLQDVSGFRLRSRTPSFLLTSISRWKAMCRYKEQGWGGQGGKLRWNLKMKGCTAVWTEESCSTGLWTGTTSTMQQSARFKCTVATSLHQ